MSHQAARTNNVLVLSPHPDDESIGCGGTLHTHALNGDIVKVIFLTSGENGGHGRSPEETTVLREQEANEAGKILGLNQVDFWRQPDGQLRTDRKTVARLQEYITAWRPELIYVTHDEEMHPDHRAAARLVRRVVSALPAESRPKVRMYEVWTPLQKMHEIVDISDHMETKLAAIRAYRSQCEVLRFDDAILGLNRYRGEMHSWPGGDYAEVFQRMSW